MPTLSGEHVRLRDCIHVKYLHTSKSSVEKVRAIRIAEAEFCGRAQLLLSTDLRGNVARQCRRLCLCTLHKLLIKTERGIALNNEVITYFV